MLLELLLVELFLNSVQKMALVTFLLFYLLSSTHSLFLSQKSTSLSAFAVLTDTSSGPFGLSASVQKYTITLSNKCASSSCSVTPGCSNQIKISLLKKASEPDTSPSHYELQQAWELQSIAFAQVLLSEALCHLNLMVFVSLEVK